MIYDRLIAVKANEPKHFGVVVAQSGCTLSIKVMVTGRNKDVVDVEKLLYHHNNIQITLFVHKPKITQKDKNSMYVGRLHVTIVTWILNTKFMTFQ